MSRLSPRDLLWSPWPYLCLAAAAVAAGAFLAPLATVALVGGAVAAAVLIWRFGPLHGLWYLVLLTIPLKEPLSFDIHGTVSVYPTDLLLLAVFAWSVSSVGLRDLWGRSRSFKIGVAIVALSTVGLYTATKLFWGVTSLYRLVMLLALFGAARVIITDRAEALRSLSAAVLSLVVPVVVGFYQAGQPFGSPLPDWGLVYTAYDAGGNPSHRAFSTLNHPLNFSHYLTIGFALSLSLAATARLAWRRVVFLGIAVASMACNLFTYSAGGLVGMLGAVAALITLRRSGKLLALVLAVLLVIALVAPPALWNKVERLMTGRALTTAARLVTYQQAFMVISDHPLFGLGWGSIRTSLEGEYRLSRADPVAFTAENYFLQRAVALGLVGLALYLGLWVVFVSNVRALGRARTANGGPDPLPTAMVVAAVAFLLQAQVIPATNVSTNSVLWLIFASAEALRDPLKRGRAA